MIMFRRIVRLLISSIYYCLIIIFKNDKTNGEVILYHSIFPGDRQKFSCQMEIVKRLTTPCTFPIGNKKPVDGNYVFVTFDDAFKNFVDNALPELEKGKIPALVFVPVNYMGKTPGWSSWGDESEMNEIVLTSEELRALPDSLITLGAHTLSHPDLTQIKKDDAKREIFESKKELELYLNTSIGYFAFPYGKYNDDHLSYCKKAGYSHAFSNSPSGMNGFLIGRIDVSTNDWDIEFKLKIMGAYRWLSYWTQLKGLIRSRFLRIIV